MRFSEDPVYPPAFLRSLYPFFFFFRVSIRTSPPPLLVWLPDLFVFFSPRSYTHRIGVGRSVLPPPLPCVGGGVFIRAPPAPPPTYLCLVLFPLLSAPVVLTPPFLPFSPANFDPFHGSRQFGVLWGPPFFPFPFQLFDPPEFPFDPRATCLSTFFSFLFFCWRLHPMPPSQFSCYPVNFVCGGNCVCLSPSSNFFRGAFASHLSGGPVPLPGGHSSPWDPCCVRFGAGVLRSSF